MEKNYLFSSQFYTPAFMLVICLLVNFQAQSNSFNKSFNYPESKNQENCPKIWSKETTCDHYNTNFVVYSNGSSFQWQISEDKGASWSNLANNATYDNVKTNRLEIIKVQETLSGNLYRLKISNDNCSIFSEAFEYNLPKITSHPRNTSPSIGKKAIFQGSASGNNLSYNWQRLNSNGTWYDLSDDNKYKGTTTNKLVVKKVEKWMDGYQFRLLISQKDKCPVPTDAAVLWSGSGGSNPCPGNENDPLEHGNNFWIGHVYDGRNFNTYKGSYNENALFEQNFGGSKNEFQVINGDCASFLRTETFSVRYRMQSSLKGLYSIIVGSDDGSRLEIDNKLIYDDWNDHAYREEKILINLSGSSRLLLEYYENKGKNVIKFDEAKLLIKNELDTNVAQTVSDKNDPKPISGDVFGNLPAGINKIGTGYQWAYNKNSDASLIKISGATGATFTPNLDKKPFNSPGTYYLYRIASLSGDNAGQNFRTSIESNRATVTVEESCTASPTVSISAPTTICAGEINIEGSFTGSAPYTIKAEVNGQVQNLQVPTDNFDYTLNIQRNTNIKILSITDAKNCTNNSPEASLDIEVISGINENNITGNQEGCGSFEPALLEGNELGVGYKYTWEKSTSGSSSGFVTASGTSNQATYQPETLTETTWYRRKVEVENCEKDFSNVIKITVGTNLNNNHISISNGNSGFISRTADERDDLNISAPANTVFTSVNFASYGTPNIENGKYVKSSCHATTSQNVTEDYLLGENSAIIPAENAVFTDPCVGTFKRLYVKASYAEPLCIGAQSPQIEGSNMGDNITYLWEMSTQGPNAGFSPAPGNNSSQNYNPGGLEQTTWFKRKATSGTCISESPVLLIPVVTENVWTGAIDVNWNNTANWSCNSLPTLKTNVLIPENLSSGNYPVVNSGANALAKNLKIENNASLKVKNNWLRISGILKSSGILNAIAGSVSFESNTAQVIPNNAFANNRIRNLRIDNSAGVTSEAIIELTGTLKVETGNFDTGNELTLISNENQTALIDGAGNGEVNGLVSMQRYLDKAFGYKYFSAPFKNSIVGDFSPYLDLNDANTSFPHFYRYNENRNIVIDGVIEDATGWTSYTNTNNPLNIGEGYALNFGTSSNPVTIEITGEVNNGAIAKKNLLNHHGTYTKGFHLIGNPYPSPIDWNAATGWTRSNIDDAIYFFNASENDQYTGSYTSYVNDVSTDNTGANASPNIIPSMQGFFVKVSDSENKNLVTGTLGMNNEVRVTDFNQQFFRSGLRDLKPLIRLHAKFKAENKEDAMVIYFSTYASTNFEKKMDAHKLMNTDPETPNFYNLTEDKKELAINAIPFPSSGSYKKIPVGLKAEKSGAMIIELNALENLSPNFNIYLIDHKKSIGQNLSKNPVYQFNVNAGTHNSRFELMFSEENVTNPAVAFNEAFHVEARGNDIIVKLNLEENQEGILQASTITGQILQVKNAKGKEEVTFKGITSDGVYIINLLVGKAQYAKKVLIKN